MDQRRFGVMTMGDQQKYETKQSVTSRYPTVVLPEGFDFFKLPKDKPSVKIDILPFVIETENGQEPCIRVNYHIHRNVNGSSVICPTSQFGKPCPICEYRKKYLTDWKDPANQERLNKIKIQTRQLYAVRYLDDTAEDPDKILVFDTSQYGFGRILDDKIQKRDLHDPSEANWDQFADYYNGYSLKLSLCEQSFGAGNTYIAVTAIDFKPRTRQYSDDWYDKVPDLSKCLNVLSYEEISERFADGAYLDQPVQPVQVRSSADRYDEDANKAFNLNAGFNPMVPVKPVTEIAEDDEF